MVSYYSMSWYTDLDHTVYALKLRTPDHWYIGSTYRAWHLRLAEHVEGYGSVWSQKHGFGSVHKKFTVPGHRANRMENETVLFYMRHVAKDWRNVKGGDYTWSRPIDMENPAHTFWVPEEFGGQRHVDY